MARHELMGGELGLYKRDDSSFWQCSAFLNGRNFRKSTKQPEFERAKEIAEDWYLGLRGKLQRGEVPGGVKFEFAANEFLKEYEALMKGERNPLYIKGHRLIAETHLIPFLKGKYVSEITSATGQEYRVHRMTSRLDPDGKPRPPARSTLNSEMVTFRMIMKMSCRRGWISFVPDFSMPYKKSGKISHRAWFSPTEYKQLYSATRERAQNPRNNRWKEESQKIHDYVLFMANTGLRPDEASKLEFRDVAIVKDVDTGERILEIEVRGKRGVGFCKSMPGAVLPFKRIQQRAKQRGKAAPIDIVFGTVQREMFNAILRELNLKTDRDGNRRTAYSLRHTYICFRLMEGADIYQIAKNCRTSVEMIEKHYAVHIKDLLDASAINRRKGKPKWVLDEEISLSE